MATNWKTALSNNPRLIPRVFTLCPEMLTPRGYTTQRGYTTTNGEHVTEQVCFDSDYVALQLARTLKQVGIDPQHKDSKAESFDLLDRALTSDIWNRVTVNAPQQRTLPHNVQVLAQHWDVTPEEAQDLINSMSNNN